MKFTKCIKNPSLLHAAKVSLKSVSFVCLYYCIGSLARLKSLLDYPEQLKLPLKEGESWTEY